MEFLKGFIGLSSTLNVEAAQSGLYVDELPDISMDVIGKLTNREEGDTINKWVEIEKRTLLKFRTLFITEVNKCHKIHDRDKCECLIDENRDLLATALWYLFGVEVMQERVASSKINAMTVDRTKNREIRQYYQDEFEKELAVAVAGINPHASTCFAPDGEPEPNSVITFVPPMI